ncbi:MAG: Ycf48-like protein precursor [Bacteroidetes bacterium ADurb.Bin234]|nr:MAG: Ycf48-like protein precursor [Bacteroidetes bacterium ADurb.Bin234]
MKLFMFKTNRMLKIDSLIFLLTILSYTTQAQWQCLSTGNTVDLYSVACISKDTVIVCGDSGTILKTINSGINWENKISGTDYNLNVIKFANKNIGYIGGGNINNGILLKTIDGGETWSPILTDSIHSIIDIFVIDADTVYFLQYWSGKLMKSIDGGNTWNKTLITDEYIFNIFMIDSVGYIVTNNAFYKTVNYANSWKKLEINFSPRYLHNLTLSSSCIFFTNVDTGFYTDSQYPIRTIDGFSNYFENETWGGMSVHARMKILPNHIGYFIKSMVDICIIFKTIDNGNTWEVDKYIPGYTYFFAIDGYDTVFYLTSENGIIYRTPEITNNIQTYNNIEIDIFPNPVTHQLTIANEQCQIKEIRMYNIVGKEVKNFMVYNTEIILDVSDLQKGIYFIKIISDQGSITKKIVKQ